MEEKFNMIAHLKTLKAGQIPSDEYIKRHLINIYNKFYKDGKAEIFYEREMQYFIAIAKEKKDITLCTPHSIFMSLVDLFMKRLSIEPGMGALAYIQVRNTKVDNNTWEKQCKLVVSGRGEIQLRINAGQIRHADNPVVVYEGDFFEFGEKDGRKFVNYSMNTNRTSNNIIACYMRITRMDGTTDYHVMQQNDWGRLRDFSAAQSKSSKANDLYTSCNGNIDPGFLIAKCIKHAFKTYPRLEVGKAMELESNTIEEEPINNFDPYAGVDNNEVAETPVLKPIISTQPGVIISTSQQTCDDIF